MTQPGGLLSRGCLVLALALPAAAAVAPAHAAGARAVTDSALAAERRAQGYDGDVRARARAAEGVRAALAESLAVPPPGAAGESVRMYGEAIRVLRATPGPAERERAAGLLSQVAEERGDARAAQLLGFLYKSGDLLGRDDARAAHFFLLATHASGGCAVAPSFAQLAHAYFTGTGVARSDSMAARAVSAAYFGAAAEACRAGYGERDRWVARQGLFYIAGESRMRGDGVRPDPSGATYQFDKGARFGEAACALRAALLFLPAAVVDEELGGTVAPDPERARGYLEQARGAGVEVASLLLARCLAMGVGGEADPARALTLFEFAAEHRLPRARFELAVRLAGGEGLPRDGERGRRELERAAREDDPRAMSVLGSLVYGEAVEARPVADARRLAEAAGWFEKAAAAGDGQAMFALGAMHRLGQHYPQDLAQAAKWFAKAKAAGVTGPR